jgi:PKD repeat protein
MRLKKGSIIIVICALFLVSVLLNIRKASSATTLSLYPAIAYDEVGSTFFMNVTVTAAQLLYDWQANVTWNPDVLNVVGITEGPFLERQPEGTFGPPPVIKEGSALFGWLTVGDHVGESGSGTLATIEFEVLAEGESIINFTRIGMDPTSETYLESQGSPNPPPNFEYIEFTPQGALFTNIVTPPNAAFTYSPIAPGLGETVTFNASASSATEPTAQITEYYWDFGDGTNTTVSTPIVEHSYDEGGDYIVSLTVIDNATASALVQSTFGTTGMPRSWYDLFGTVEHDVAVAVPHEVAVTGVSLSATTVTAGETVTITAQVLNKGTETESFSVKAYYDTNEIDTKQVSNLVSEDGETLTFDWNTAGVPEGNYRIIVEIPAVEGETVTGNNRFIDGTVKVNLGAPFPITYMIVGAVVVAVIVLGLGYFMLRRRRKA